MQRYRDELSQMELDMDMEEDMDPDFMDLDDGIGVFESDDDYDYEMLREMKEERDAYDDLIASLDMND